MKGTGRSVGERLPRGILVALVCVRLAIPLAALAASGHKLPAMPRYDYQPLGGDTYGFYWAARELIASIPEVPAPLLGSAAIAVIAALVVSVRMWRARPEQRWLAIAVPSIALSLAAALVIREMSVPGAGVIGWPLVWAAVLLPYRALGFVPTPDIAYGIGLPLSLAAIAVITVTTAYLGLYATGRRWVGLGAAGLFTFWPLLSGLLTGNGAWENGQWNVDAGLSLYTEPFSTALVVAALVLLLRPGVGSTGIALAGLLVGFSTVVKLTNGLLAAVLVAIVATRFGMRRGVQFALAGLASAPILAAYWSKGYVGMFGGQVSANEDPFALAYFDDSWLDSAYFTPTLLLLLAPLLVLGCFTLDRPYALLLVIAPIVLNASVYSFYDVTRVHPRFLYIALPSVFVLEAAGAVRLVTLVRRARASGPQPEAEP